MVHRKGYIKILPDYQLEKLLREKGIENAKEVTDALCGRGEDRERTEWYKYQVVDNTDPYYIPVKFWQRLNQLWIIPLLTLSVPFQWLFLGRVGFKSTSKVAKLMVKLTGIR